jgi:FAD-dependent halogenase
MLEETFDLIVVGGGPAGSTLATFVAKRDHKVLLLEQQAFPRHQIGESLLPATVHGICPLLGVSEELKAAQFPRKYGGTFSWGSSDVPWTFQFALSKHMGTATGFAYQVERAKFDAILLNNARKHGVQIIEPARVTAALTSEQRVTGVRWTDAAGHTHESHAKFLADASGNESLLYRQITERVYSEYFQNVALYGYFLNGKRLPKPNDGNVLTAAFAKGWFWYIPLSDTLTSVGAVVSKDNATLLRDGHRQALQQFVFECPIIAQYLSNATPVTEGPYAKLRVRKDYSYCCSKFWAPGMMLVGDAACFVDPVFSSGVHLATYSALLAARSVNSSLTGTLSEERAFAEFETRYRREFGNFYQFIRAFYDMHQDKESYFWAARDVLKSNEAANEAFARLVAGIGSSGEPLFASSQELFDAMSAVSNSFQRAQSAPGEFHMNRLDSRFMSSLTKGGTELQMRAALPGAAERAWWPGGLVPTGDGLEWSSGTRM